VLTAMGLAGEKSAVIRISASRYTTNDDYTRLRDALCLAFGQLRQQST
jgi:cysteine sulfinate desulfinase/cysteine desulfurase-like protein